MDGSEQLAADAEEENFVRLIVRDLGKSDFFDQVEANPRESLVARLMRAYLDILLDILRRPVLMQKAVPVLQDMDALDILQPYIGAKCVHCRSRSAQCTCSRRLQISIQHSYGTCMCSAVQYRTCTRIGRNA